MRIEELELIKYALRTRQLREDDMVYGIGLDEVQDAIDDAVQRLPAITSEMIDGVRVTVFEPDQSD